MKRDTRPQTFAGCYFSERHNALVGPNQNIRSLRRQSLTVFQFLAKQPGSVIDKETIVCEVWRDVQVTDDSLVQCISEIRKALGDTSHNVLKTVPRRGYMLVADKPSATADLQVNKNTRIGSIRVWNTAAIFLFVAVIILTGNTLFFEEENDELRSDDSSTLKIEGNTEGADEALTELFSELRVSLNRYQTVKISKNTDSDFKLHLDKLSSEDSSQRLTIELLNTANNEVIFAERYESRVSADATHQLAVRIAAAIATPGIGAIDRHLLYQSRLKPIEELTRAECYANGYGCAKCSGEEDNITHRAEECLAYILKNDPKDSRAWALQATIYAHQYWWGNTLSEPQKSNLDLRRDLPQRAIDAANRSESLSNGKDSSVYWGMAEAYFSSCQADKLQTVISRGLELNPDDPNLLASFGNWLSYSGKWDEGAALTRRALEIEPQHYRKWWWMGIAKTHYFKEEFGEAYAAFMKAYNDRNWVSHLQLAYTLPHLNRLPEAKVAVKNLQKLSPGITLERALEVYEILCFPDSFLSNMKIALMQAGLPSIGDSQDFDNIVLPRAQTIDVDGLTVEYLDEGDGEPILFVHGDISDYRSWGHYLAPISKNNRYISYSRRYFGSQSWQDQGGNWSKDLFAQDLIQFIEELNLGSVHLVSWSSGGQPAVKAAIDRPDLFKSVIHYEPFDKNIFIGDDSIAAVQKDYFAKWPSVFELIDEGDNEGAAKNMIEIVFSLGKGGFKNEREIQREVVRQNARTMPLIFGPASENDTKLTCDFIGQTKVPTKIVVGSSTLPYLARISERYKECIPHATLETIKHANHRAPIEKVDELSRIILEFVEKHK